MILLVVALCRGVLLLSVGTLVLVYFQSHILAALFHAAHVFTRCSIVQGCPSLVGGDLSACFDDDESTIHSVSFRHIFY